MQRGDLEEVRAQLCGSLFKVLFQEDSLSSYPASGALQTPTVHPWGARTYSLRALITLQRLLSFSSTRG